MKYVKTFEEFIAEKNLQESKHLTKLPKDIESLDSLERAIKVSEVLLQDKGDSSGMNKRT